MDLSDVIEELIETVDILEYISQYVELTEKNGEYWGLSPFKDEKTPSFSVRHETKSFYDFSSGVGGNVLTFVRFYNKCSVQKAVEILTEYAGKGDGVAINAKLSAVRVAKRFQRHKKEPKKDKSTILPDDYMDRYDTDSAKLDVWRQEGISDASMDRFLVRYDRFSNRLVYPIRNPEGKIVNVGGRTLEPGWKELGLRKYTYFMSWGELKTIYGLAENMDEILKKREIILFEGCKSVLVADTWGIRNTGAILTSHLNPNQRKLLIQLGCRVVFAFDKEVNIRADHNIGRLRQYVKVEYVKDRENLLSPKDSPVDKGPEVWKRLYEGRLSWT